MPCVDAVFMYSMLVVAGDSWWSIPLNVCVLCGHTHFRFSFKLMPVLDLKWNYLSFRIFSKLMTPKVLGVSHISVFKNQNALKKIKRALKQYFWTEVQQVGRESTVVWTENTY